MSPQCRTSACLSVRHCAVVSWGRSQLFTNVSRILQCDFKTLKSDTKLDILLHGTGFNDCEGPTVASEFQNSIKQEVFSFAYNYTYGRQADLQHIARVAATPRDDLTATVHLHRLVLTCLADEILLLHFTGSSQDRCSDLITQLLLRFLASKKNVL